MIEVSGLCKSYGAHEVLHNIDMCVHEGEIFGIVGHSGAGKSTLLRCLNGLEPYQEGQREGHGRGGGRSGRPPPCVSCRARWA